MNPFTKLLIAACVAAGLALPAFAQDNVRVEEDGPWRYTFTVDQLVYGFLDDIEMNYRVENISAVTDTFQVCGCGVEFYVVRDTLSLGEDGSEVAGCDACPVCFLDEVCSFDPCEAPIVLAPGEFYDFPWAWDRARCEGDFGYPGGLGNVGTFNVIAGWNACPVGCFSNVLEIPILVTTQTPVDPVTWGTLKSRFGAPDPPEEPQP
jgi:hypothetical protein